MRKEIDDRDDFEETDAGRVPVFPTSVRIAGIVWIVFGSIIILNAIVSAGLTAGAGGANGANAAGGACGAIIPLLIGIAFIFVGQQTLRGTARDTLGNAIGSLVLGIGPLVCGFLAIIGGVALANAPAKVPAGEAANIAAIEPGVLMVLGVVNILSGFGLLTAGALALIGRAEYREWRRWKRAPQPRD